jgi:hypothetical protein
MYRQAEIGVRQIGLDPIRQMMGVDGHGRATGPFQIGDHAAQHGDAVDRKQRLGQDPGMRRQPGSEPGGQHQRPHDRSRFR